MGYYFVVLQNVDKPGGSKIRGPIHASKPEGAARKTDHEAYETIKVYPVMNDEHGDVMAYGGSQLDI